MPGEGSYQDKDRGTRRGGDLIHALNLKSDKAIPEREKHTYIKAASENILPLSNVQTTPGDFTERGCTYAGCKGVVCGTIKDVIHLVHGPIGCA